jgi:hypothetical protein
MLLYTLLYMLLFAELHVGVGISSEEYVRC